MLGKGVTGKTYKWDSKYCGDVGKKDKRLGEHCKDFKKVNEWRVCKECGGCKSKKWVAERDGIATRKILHVEPE